MVAETFKFIVLRLLQIYLWVKKLNLFIFTHTLRQNSPSPPPPPSPQVFVIILQSDGNCPFLRFLKIFFSEEKGGEDYRVEKITKINKDIGQKSW